MLLDSGGTTGGSESHSSFESVIDPPLETGEGTNHEDSGAKTSPETSHTDFGVDLRHIFTQSSFGFDIVQLGHHSVGGVTHDGAENTGQVTRGEGNAQLSSLGVFILGLGKDILIELFNNIFESDELHHGVRHLTAPEGNQTLEESLVA